MNSFKRILSFFLILSIAFNSFVFANPPKAKPFLGKNPPVFNKIKNSLKIDYDLYLKTSVKSQKYNIIQRKIPKKDFNTFIVGPQSPCTAVNLLIVVLNNVISDANEILSQTDFSKNKKLILIIDSVQTNLKSLDDYLNSTPNHESVVVYLNEIVQKIMEICENFSELFGYLNIPNLSEAIVNLNCLKEESKKSQKTLHTKDDVFIVPNTAPLVSNIHHPFETHYQERICIENKTRENFKNEKIKELLHSSKHPCHAMNILLNKFYILIENFNLITENYILSYDAQYILIQAIPFINKNVSHINDNLPNPKNPHLSISLIKRIDKILHEVDTTCYDIDTTLKCLIEKENNLNFDDLYNNIKEILNISYSIKTHINLTKETFSTSGEIPPIVVIDNSFKNIENENIGNITWDDLDIKYISKKNNNIKSHLFNEEIFYFSTGAVFKKLRIAIEEVNSFVCHTPTKHSAKTKIKNLFREINAYIVEKNINPYIYVHLDPNDPRYKSTYITLTAEKIIFISVKLQKVLLSYPPTQQKQNILNQLNEIINDCNKILEEYK